MSREPLVRMHDHDGVAVVTLDRPPANAIDPELLADGLAVLERLTDDPPGATVLTGTERFFCGGADLQVVPFLEPDEAAAMARDINRVFSGWYHLACPLVCAVNGHAVAGGLVLALCGDHRVVGTSGRFGLTEVKVGIPYPSQAMAVVQGELTPQVARRLVLRGELFDAATATTLGVFDEQVADGAVLDRALEVAHEMAELPATTFTLVKQRLRAGTGATAGMFGGSGDTPWATGDSRTAARAVLDAHRATKASDDPPPPSS